MLNKVLIANRGAIACRIIRTLKQMNITSVAVYSEADAESLHVLQANEAYSLGEGAAAATYLDQQKIIALAKSCKADAIHPGYGFLSENPAFVTLCEQSGITFLGPTPEQMTTFGLKHAARAIASQADVPLLPGSDLISHLEDAQTQAEQIGYPVMLKSTAGGGGIGMQRCNHAAELAQSLDSVRRLSENNFSHSGIFLEKFIEQARHIEVQIFGDGQGQVIALGERDCSAQRRNQKVIEETPAPNLSETTRQALRQTAIRLAAAVNYRSAGTVEFVLDQQSEQFYFLEVNTRLQVEHGVTEEVFGIDLVEWMVQQGAGTLDLSAWQHDQQPDGHAIQVRLYAEDPNKNFQPSAGLISHVEWPQLPGVRIEHWIEAGVEVSPYFDPMLAKIIVHGANRAQALARMTQALSQISLYGPTHNQCYLQQLIQTPRFQDGQMLTRSLDHFVYQPHTVDILNGGTQTTIQDYPGRQGYWHVGVPPSGPMDSLSFRLANQLLHNDDHCAGLEIIVTGPTLRFNMKKQIVLTGATIQATLDDQPLPMGMVTQVNAGQTLRLGKITGPGARSYLAVAGGFQCPDYLGSKSTFTLGQFGGHTGRALRSGDVLQLDPSPSVSTPEKATVHPAALPVLSDSWQIHVMYGPHGAPDFFTDDDIQAFFAASWTVHFNSSRTGVRLVGPKPDWARPDGGEAGLHPSNIHDNAYAIGTIDFTGDMPVILGPDGPSLGGFVCPATVIKADLWKIGQLKAGDKVHFVPVTLTEAEDAERRQHAQIRQCQVEPYSLTPVPPDTPVVAKIPASANQQQVIYRQCGEDFLLVEYGPQILDIRLRFRVHALMLKLEQCQLSGVHELTPGIRSLQIHYDNLHLPRQQLLDTLIELEQQLGDIDQLTVPARIVHLPLSWDDEATRLAIRKYEEVVRKDAPWCPDNIEFIRRINGLKSVDDVKQIVFDASYLVMGLGDVYLGAPVATPLDPRHRLVTTKYNPARTWTPENAVGIGGSYLCVYGMEGPGGYQFVGRTLQMWNRYRTTPYFQQPWLLQFFDQIRFYPVSADELQTIRRQHPRGQYPLKIETTTFSLATYQTLIDNNADTIAQCKSRQQAAFEAERQRWADSGQANFVAEDVTLDTTSEHWVLDEGCEAVESHVTGNIWQIQVQPGQTVATGETIAVLEAMKMELEVASPISGTVETICHTAGSPIQAGQPILTIRTADSASLTTHSVSSSKEAN
ncbi:urea carboxylase [Vibrio spartinae]|uniref:Biotin carboxylase n=1 Tax=Vibrio spartinae TaxID=1918945 RepID=A0A1N6M839_9VIBR|nr:urea carboxylase [Vibrio spartinae]SIO95530.1 Acetyl-/propionyl-coenzyme A carboxylase alpha chain [Vibrio spartinae]